MMPIGPLMIEHRLIEQVIEIMRMETENIKMGKQLEPSFIDTVVDFIQIYADRTHHGKEEDILFKDLMRRKISVNDRKVMDELINEHRSARKTVRDTIEAKNQYFSGDSSKLAILLEMFNQLINLYPEHIKKKTKCFSLRL